MTKPAAVPEHDEVTVEIDMQAPPERVFAALTDPKQLFAWGAGSRQSSCCYSRWMPAQAAFGDFKVRWHPVLTMAKSENNSGGIRQRSLKPTARCSNTIRRAVWYGAGSQIGMSIRTTRPSFVGI